MCTNSPNFYIGRSADVGDMLLHGQVVSVTLRFFAWDGSVELPRAELFTQEVFRECTSAISH